MLRSSLRIIATGPLAIVAIAVSSNAAPATAQMPARSAADTTPRRYTDADVCFMQHMIGHHAQALTMTSLVPARSRRADLRLLAQRIAASQREEIAMMRRWLTDRGQTVPSPDDEQVHHEMAGMAGMPGMSGHEALMPGMLSAEDLAQLTKSSGDDFGRLFLRFMIRHHEGAITMVTSLFATKGAGQEPEIFRFASDVETDQRAEINRMRTMLMDPFPLSTSP